MTVKGLKIYLYEIKKILKKWVTLILWDAKSVVEDFGMYKPRTGDLVYEIRPGKIVTLSASPDIGTEMNQSIASEAFLTLKPLWYCELGHGYVWTDHSTNVAILDRNRNLLGPVSFTYVKDDFGRYIHGTGNQNKYIREGPRSFPVKLSGTVVSLLSGGGRNINFYHWHMDIISRLYYISKYITLKKVDCFLFPEINQDFQKKTLQIIGIPLDKIVFDTETRFYQAERLITVSHPRTATFEAPADLVAGLKSILKTGKELDIINSPKKVYLSRAKADRRKVLNEVDVIRLVKEYGYSVIYLEDMSFNETIHLFRSVESVISPHGAGILNTLYSHKFKLLIELFPHHFVNPYYEKYAHSIGADYHFIKGVDTGEAAPSSRYDAQNLDIMVNLVELGQLLADISD